MARKTQRGSDARDSVTAGVTIEICTACDAGPDGSCSGQRLFDHLADACREIPDVAVSPVDCFAVCDRPVTIAFRRHGKWSYMLGDISAGIDAAAIVSLAQAIAASPEGIPAMADRPEFCRAAVVCRIPPDPGAI
ncbi:MAG: DUF1636 domain-containing protein [Rhodospirillales bacterium]